MNERFALEPTVEADAPAIAALHAAVAEDLTRRFGKGPWSFPGTERGVLHAMRTSKVYVVRPDGVIAGTLTLATKKPWAIDVRSFTPVEKALYLINMAVAPARQGAGIGRLMLEQAARVAEALPAGAIRLDAYDAPAGAGAFYERCGYRETARVTYRRAPLIYYERLLPPRSTRNMKHP